MVRYLDACDFMAACTALAGGAPSRDRRRTDQAERQRRAEARAAAAAERERLAIEYREAERRKAYDLWRSGAPLLHSSAEAYLKGRSLIVPVGAPLRCLDACPYWHPVDGRPRAIYAGPALLAAITDDAGRFAGVHITWIDPGHPGRKLAIVDPVTTGTMLPAKKIRGSKRRGAIRLADPPDAGRLVVGEGIETVLSAFTAELPPGPPSAYWAAVDLGHLGGKATETVRHPTLTKTDRGGRERPARVPGARAEPQPERDLMAPERFSEIVILGDGDSDRFTTERALRRAAARWRRPGRTIRIAWAPEGRDFNDVLCEADVADDARGRIARIIASAEPVSVDVGDSNDEPPWSEDGAGACAAERTAWPPPEATAELDQRLAIYPLTDLGNSERFIARHGGSFMWCPSLGWLAWDGRRWSRNGAEGIVDLTVQDTVRAIQAEAAAIRGTNSDFAIKAAKTSVTMYSDQLAAWGRASEMANRLAAVARIAGPRLEVDAAKLDADPYAINVLNGTLHVSRTENADGDFITLRPHNPADLITKLAPVEYDRDAERTVFDAFLEKVQPDPANQRFLAQWLGLSLTGDVSEQKLAFLYGGGRNGKSTLVDVAAYVAGDYSETVPVETFLAGGRGRNAGSATPDLAILPGVRFLRTSEPEKGAKLAEALIKAVTGGEPIQARHLNRGYFRFYPQFKLTMSGNHRPNITGADEGIWRRVMLMIWEVTIPLKDVDRELQKKLRAEASGILNWLLDGLRDWLASGLVMPSEVLDATREYRDDSDPLGRFLETCVASEMGSSVQSSKLYQLFIAWAKANGEREWTATGFSKAISERGYKREKSSLIYWLDVRLTKTMADFDDANAGPGRAPSEGEVG